MAKIHLEHPTQATACGTCATQHGHTESEFDQAPVAQRCKSCSRVLAAARAGRPAYSGRILEKPSSGRSLVLTELWSGNHRPYSNMLRDGHTDEDLGQINPTVLQELIRESGAQDGDEIEIVVRRTGRRPFGDRKVRLVAPGTYERETKS